MRPSLDWCISPTVLSQLEGDELRDALLMLADELPDAGAEELRRLARRCDGLAPVRPPPGRWQKHRTGWVSTAYTSLHSRWRESYPFYAPSILDDWLHGRLKRESIWFAPYTDETTAWADLLRVLTEGP